MTKEQQIERLNDAPQRMRENAERHVRSPAFQAVIKKYDNIAEKQWAAMAEIAAEAKRLRLE